MKIFDDLIVAHVQWRIHLGQCVDGLRNDGRFVSDVVSKDNICVTGKWLFGEGLAYQTLPQYQHLVKVHADVHRCAADAVGLVEVGNFAEAKVLLQTGFTDASRNTVLAIVALRQAVTMNTRVAANSQ